MALQNTELQRERLIPKHLIWLCNVKLRHKQKEAEILLKKKNNSEASHPLSEEPELASLAAVFPHSVIPSGPHCAYIDLPSTAVTQIMLQGLLCANDYSYKFFFFSLHVSIRDWKAVRMSILVTRSPEVSSDGRERGIFFFEVTNTIHTSGL